MMTDIENLKFTKQGISYYKIDKASFKEIENANN